MSTDKIMREEIMRVIPELRAAVYGKPLVSLEEHDERKRAERAERDRGTPNGIACPGCGEELRDDGGYISMTLMTHPPRTGIHCEACKWTGTRIR